MSISLQVWDARLREMFGLSLLGHPARLRDGLCAACRDLAIGDDAELLARVDRGERAAKVALARALTIGETYFFREAQHFELLRNALLPRAFARGEPPVRLVSAGCASGEEAYSLAIVANEVLGRAAAEQVRVLGFDINERALALARRGSYRPWSLRGVPDQVRKRWFERAGNEWRIGAAARSLTRFERGNLVDPAGCLPRSSSDVIFCRNVLIYLAEDAVALVLRALSQALRPGGVLIVGSAEASFFRAAGLGAHRLGDVWVHGAGEPPSGGKPAAEAELATRWPRSTPRRGVDRPARAAVRPLKESPTSLAESEPEPAVAAPAAREDGGSDALRYIEDGWSALASDPAAASADARRALLLDRRLAAAHVLAATAALAQSSFGATRRSLRHARRYLAVAEAREPIVGGGGATAAEMRVYCARIERSIGGRAR